MLRQYIRAFILESNSDIIELDELDDDKKVDEFSAVSGGAIAGFTAPLGWSGKDLEGPGTKERRKKKRKPSWK